MIKLTKDNLDLKASSAYGSNYSREYSLFGLNGRLKKKGKGEFLVWTNRTEAFADQIKGVLIDVHGKLTWHTLKDSLERSLNYQPSHLRYAIMKGQFTKKS